MSKRVKYVAITLLVIVVLAVCFILVRQRNASPVSYIGLTESQAIELAADREQTFRIVSRDGKSLPSTDDYRPDRINFEIDNGKVTKATNY